jgi:hypothetical protein
MRSPCFICDNAEAQPQPTQGDFSEWNCPECGRYEISGSAAAASKEKLSENKALFQHTLYKMKRDGNATMLTVPLIDKIIEETALPDIQEQAENLIRHFGDLRTPSPGSVITLNSQELNKLVIIAGSPDQETVGFLLMSLKNKKLLEEPDSGLTVRLTLDGWGYYNELKHKASESYLAFMAMPFNKEDLDKVYLDCFKPAVAKTGFELRRLDENPVAGIIDNHLRVEIRKARFLIAELTHENPGVYWEAGFAEGLGRPVIYTCEKSNFNACHFDTNHCQIVKWSLDNLPKAAEDLKTTIRVTLPTVAKQSDD